MSTYSQLIPVFAAAGLFASLFAGCGTKEYKPLVPEKAAVVAFCSSEGINKDAKVKSVVDNLIAAQKDAGVKSADKLLEEYPELKDSETAKLMKMSSDEAFEYVWGIPQSSVKWSLFTAVPCRVTDGKAFTRCPDFAFVLCFDKKVDFAKAYSKIKDLNGQYVKALFAKDGNDPEEVMAEIKKNVSLDEGLYNGAFAVTLSLADETKKILSMENTERFSPILTTICDGQLIVLASSKEHLAEIDKMYNGTIPAAPADSKLANELNVPVDNLFRFSILDVIGTAKTVMPEEEWKNFNDDVLADETPAGKYVKAADIVRFDCNVDAETESYIASLNVVFNDSGVSSELKQTLEPMLMLGKIAASGSLQSDPESEQLMALVNSAELKLDGQTLALTVKAPVQAVVSLMNMASGKFGDSCCPGCGDDDDIFPDDDEIDDDDADEAAEEE